MNNIEIKAKAKINITLDVLNKRKDGYHNVKMIMQTVDLYDMVYLKKIDRGIQITTNLNYLPVNNKNIAYRAAELFFERTNIHNAGIHIDILKRIPVSAGLAGGSANAAAVLIAMNRLFDTGLQTEQLMEMGKSLGADVPYCIIGGTALAEGIGDIITLLPPMPTVTVVLAKPPFSISTASIYKKLNVDNIVTRPNTEAVINAIYNQDIKGIAKEMYNVLEPVTSKNYKIINRIKNIMLGSGALGAIMSGSGPTVFGVFENDIEARRAFNKLKTIVNDLFIVRTCNTND